MSKELSQLIEQLTLQKQAEDCFVGRSTDIFHSGRVFGGQVLGQSLAAALYTIPQGRSVHSMHAYFVRPGDTRQSIRYEVDCTRDGRSFSVRHVLAKQNDKTIFHMTCSFQVTEDGFDHFDPMPAGIPAPEDCPTEAQVRERFGLRPPSRPNAIDIRVAKPEHFSGDVPSTDMYLWFKANGDVPADALIQNSMLAYASDFFLLFAACQPHGIRPFSDEVQLASLDHALWFHRPIDVNDWILYKMHSPNAVNARGLSFGQFYNRQGQLLASSAQEGLTRINPSKPSTDR